MGAKTHTIEIDEATAAALQRRASERGVSVSRLVSELVLAPDEAPPSSGDIAELDQRWSAVEAGQAAVVHSDVVRWLETWGTPRFKPWAER